MRLVTRVLLPPVLALLLSPAALADLFTAQLAYDKGEYERAFHDYRELAELGQSVAQYNLAIMYANGQGARQSDINAYAWASVAAENGQPDAKLLADRLRPQLAPGSEQLADDIAAPYRRAALEARLMPKIGDDEGTRQQCTPVKIEMPVYPIDLRYATVQGNLVVEFAIPPDGTARNPRVSYSMPPGVFDESARRAVLRTRFAVRAAGEPAIHCRLMYRFVAQSEGAADYPELEAYVRSARKQAEAGSAKAEYLYGLLLSGFPQLRHSEQDALPWFLKAAQQGQRQAQYAVGRNLMWGRGCQCEESKAEVWIRKAAEADEPGAQVTLAQFALRGSPDAADTAKAKVWLERAVAHGDHDGMLYLSALLAATPIEQLRDPPRALTLLDKVRKDLGGDPIELEIRAAAQAASGEFSKAVDSERKAVRAADALHWDLAPLKERLDLYGLSRPWYGNLLAL
ncbi:MAG: SEL1-like repeat protein [Gammaproteobacteria bacterium]|nr:SEL1-like repeat protein [Gammaproteobacteria bacterium]